MPDVLDAAAQAMMADVLGSVNRNELVLPASVGGDLKFPPRTLLCWDIEWIASSKIIGRCWYNPGEFDFTIAWPGGSMPVKVRRSVHFPDHVLWRVDHAPPLEMSHDERREAGRDRCNAEWTS